MPPDDESRDLVPAKLQGTADRARQTDQNPRLVAAARYLRSKLPGDPELGDPLSTAGDRPRHVLARGLSDVAAARDSLTREVGLGAIQVWQALSEAQGRGRGDEEVAILFTDLVEFSAWALEAGDEAAVELLRQVARAAEPPVTSHGGRVVKRLGDGFLAVFGDARQGVEAAQEAVAATARRGGRRLPPAAAGRDCTSGRPRKLGGDFLGVDVNIAARVAEAAAGGEVLVSDTACANLDESAFRLRRKRRFRAKGAPRDLSVYAVEPA